jgi:hypothetical protein
MRQGDYEYRFDDEANGVFVICFKILFQGFPGRAAGSTQSAGLLPDISNKIT